MSTNNTNRKSETLPLGLGLPSEFQISISAAFRWETVRSDPGADYIFPGSVSPYLKSNYSRPAVYRWIACEPKLEFPCIYIGEAESLLQRLNSYLTGRNKHAAGLKAALNEKIQIGWTVKLDVLKFSPFRVNGILVSESSLHDQLYRRMVESLAVVARDRVRYEVANRNMNPIERKSAKGKRYQAMSWKERLLVEKHTNLGTGS